MAPDGSLPSTWIEIAASGRTDRQPLVAFSTDAATEAALQRGLADLLAGPGDFRRGGLEVATGMLRRMPTPRHLIIDISGHPQPLLALEDLAQVVEPDVKVLVVGEREDMDLYRKITRGLGALDYISKPLTPSKVAEHFGPHISFKVPERSALHGGRVIALVGARGGVGTSTLAANLAWYLASQAGHHSVLLDADLAGGTGALLLSAKPGDGLCAALGKPERMDNLLIERATTAVSDRLHVLAAEDGTEEPPDYVPGAAKQLIGLLERRFNFIVVDVPRDRSPFARELLKLAHHRVMVIEPSLAAVRDGLRLLQVQGGMMEVRRPLVVLNRAGRPGGLTTAQVTAALRQAPEISIPDLPHQIGQAATLGEVAAAGRGPFRTALGRLATETATVVAEGPVRRGMLQRLGLRR